MCVFCADVSSRLYFSFFPLPFLPTMDGSFVRLIMRDTLWALCSEARWHIPLCRRAVIWMYLKPDWGKVTQTCFVGPSAMEVRSLAQIGGRYNQKEEEKRIINCLQLFRNGLNQYRYIFVVVESETISSFQKKRLTWWYIFYQKQVLKTFGVFFFLNQTWRLDVWLLRCKSTQSMCWGWHGFSQKFH